MTFAISNDIETFVRSLQLPLEYMVLFKTVGDCQSFYIGFYGKNKHIIDDLLDYREHLLFESKITVNMFLDMCITNMKEALESTFLQSFTTEDVGLINHAILVGKTDLEEMYLRFQKNSNENILKNVL